MHHTKIDVNEGSWIWGIWKLHYLLNVSKNLHVLEKIKFTLKY